MAATAAEVAGVLASGALALYSGQHVASHRDKCPLHKGVFILSAGGCISAAVYLLVRQGRKKGPRDGHTAWGSVREPESVVELVRPNVRSLEPYRCARDDYSEGVLLDANENAFGPALREDNRHQLERYPDPYQRSLKEKVGKYRCGFPNKIPNSIKSLPTVTCMGVREAITLVTPLA
jgi:hypothetical protein